MAVLALHFPIGDVTIAQRLRAMLATCETKADCSAWAGDYFQVADILPVEDQRGLVKLANDHFRIFGRAI